MEQNDLILQKLQASPEYRMFRNIMKVKVTIISGLIVCALGIIIHIMILFHNNIPLLLLCNTISAFLFLVCVCYVTFIAAWVFRTKPDFIAEGVIRDTKEIKQGKDVQYLVSIDADNQKYWTLGLASFDDVKKRKFTIGKRVLCFSVTPEQKFIVLD
jgi:hypothetical protein